jgi:Ca2+-binding EF-hand superfamily protein
VFKLEVACVPPAALRRKIAALGRTSQKPWEEHPMRSVALASLVVLTLLGSSALAARHPRHRSNGAARAAAAQREAAFLQQFDANGDGQLDPTERQVAVTALQQMKHPGGKALAAGGKNSGKLSEAKKQELIKRFDNDGDGKLDATERETAKQAIEKLAAGK